MSSGGRVSRRITEQPTPSMKAAVSRAFKRLVERGLMEKTGGSASVYALTHEGLEKAATL